MIVLVYLLVEDVPVTPAVEETVEVVEWVEEVPSAVAVEFVGSENVFSPVVQLQVPLDASGAQHQRSFPHGNKTPRSYKTDESITSISRG